MVFGDGAGVPVAGAVGQAVCSEVDVVTTLAAPVSGAVVVVGPIGSFVS